MSAHVGYLQRDGVTEDGERGRLFNAARDDADGDGFAERCEGDRHHFRFIVAPEDGAELSDLKAFTRDLMAGAERDLGTGLDWIAVGHFNTAHPHVHVLVRGRDDDGQDLVISRDYIGEGLRARAAQIVTLELGPRTDREVQRALEAETSAERWTKLDRALARQSVDGAVDLRPRGEAAGDPYRELKVSRLRKLERLGLASSHAPGQWRISRAAEPTLQALARRNDVIARLHRAFARTDGRDPSRFVLDPDEGAGLVVGRLAARGLDDELRGSAYAIIDGVDGRAHHVALPNLEAATDAKIGVIVEARPLANGQLVLRVRSDLDLQQQCRAEGATWLDRQLVSRDRAPLTDDGFGRQVNAALSERVEHLISSGFAGRDGQQIVFTRDMLASLRRRELDGLVARTAAETGLPHRPSEEGHSVEGVYRKRLDLASGRFAMLDDGLGFQLVPWRPELERLLGQRVTGTALPDGGVDWSFGRKRGPSR